MPSFASLMSSAARDTRSSRLHRGFAVAAALFCGTIATASAAAPPKSMFGVQTHMLNLGRFFPGMSAYWDPAATAPLVQQLGVSWIRDGVCAYTGAPHALVSTHTASAQSRGAIMQNRQFISNAYDMYDKMGIKVVFTIMALPPEVANAAELNADFKSFVTQMVAEHPSIYAVELHNEPSSTLSWIGTPEEYVSTYRVLADAVHAARPDIKVLGGGGSGLWWSQSFYQRTFAAGMMSFIDGISVHPYNNGNVPPEVDVSYGSHGTYEDSLVAMWAQFQKANTTNKPLEFHFTELGYASTPGSMMSTPSDTIQAAYLSRLMLMYQDLRARGLPITSLEWYDLKNDGADTGMQHNFGLTSFDLSMKKPAFDVYHKIIAGFPNNGDIVEPPFGVTAAADHNASAVQLRTWARKSDGAIVVAFWRLDQNKSVLTDFNGIINLQLPRGVMPTKVNMSNACGASYNSKFDIVNGSVRVPANFAMCAGWITVQTKQVVASAQ